MQSLFQDLRYGVRMLVHQRGFTAVAVLTLALGIGANTAVFTLIDATLLQDAPGEDSERVMSIFSGTVRNPYSSASYPDYVDIRDNVEAFSGVAAYGGIRATWDTGETTEILVGMIATGNYFQTLKMRPATGRFFLPEEDATPGTHPVAVISYRMWNEKFGTAESVVGSQLLLNGSSFTVIGVAPVGFTGLNITESSDVWIPMMMQALVRPPRAGFYKGMDPDLLSQRGLHWLSMFGRLESGVNSRSATAELDVLAHQIEEAYPQSNTGIRFMLYPFNSGNPQAREALVPVATLLMVVVVLVLLIACANVANLTMVRVASRRSEIATRIALGAGRGRLVRQFLTESLLLFLMGGVAGLFLATWTAVLLTSSVASRNLLPIFVSVNPVPSPRVLLFTLGATLITAVIFGLAPAYTATRANIGMALKNSIGRRQNVLNGLVMVQVTVSVVLLIGTGLFLRSLQNTQAIDPGFKADNMLMMPLNVNLLAYSREEGRHFYTRIMEEIESIPGVESTALARVSTLSGGGRRISLLIEGQEAPEQGFPNIVGANVVSTGYFRTMGLPLVSGRDFRATDSEGSLLVCIVNEAMIQRFWPEENPIGKHVQTGGPDSPILEVVGIAQDGKYVSLVEETTAFLYLPLLQNHESGVTLHIRTSAEPASLIDFIRQRIRSLEPNLPVLSIRTMSDQLRSSLYPARLGTILIATFGLLAFLLAAVGVYGVMSYSVARRTREIGIRMVLGAGKSDVFQIVLKRSTIVVGTGVLIGIIAAIAIASLLKGFLYGVGSWDPISFGAVVLMLGLVSLIAGFLPARRVMKIDPVEVLRME